MATDPTIVVPAKPAPAKAGGGDPVVRRNDGQVPSALSRS